jgi:pimeloyl-ACP methyl ester carboxylesterase
MPIFDTREGVRLHYTDAGSGRPALLFVHGWSSNLRHWEPQARHFRRHHRVLRVDLRGHGRSPAPDLPVRGYSIPRHAEDLAALLRRLRLRSVVAVGHSSGGWVSLALAARFPELVRAVVVVDSSFEAAVPAAELEQHPLLRHLRRGPFAEQLGQAYRGMFRNFSDPALRERVTAEAAATSPLASERTVRANLRTDRAALARRVRQPVLCVYASNTARNAEELRGVIPQAQFAQVVGAGHFLQLEVPEQLNPMIERFLELLPARRERA